MSDHPQLLDHLLAKAQRSFRVAEAVRRMREDVIWLEDEFPHDVPDEEWLAVAREKGWLVIPHDRKIRTRPGERPSQLPC